MTTEEIIEKLPLWNKLMIMSANEFCAVTKIQQKVQKVVGLYPVNEIESTALAKFSKLIWLSARNYKEE